jgi:MscS family membrane protein
MFLLRRALQSLVVSTLLASATPVLLSQGFTALLPSGKSSAQVQAGAKDSLRRTTPRSSIYNFLEACHEDNFPLAAQYLDLRNYSPQRRATEGPERAKELGTLLDRNPHFEVAQVSDAPEGNPALGLTPGTVNLATFENHGTQVTLQMKRVNQNGMEVWLVSASSVARLPGLVNLITSESSFERKLPVPLVTTKLIGTPVWIWMALVLMALALSLLSRLLIQVLLAAVTPVAKRYAKSIQTNRLAAFSGPLRLLISVIVFRACMEMTPPSALVRDYILKLLILLFVLGSGALAMRVVDLASDRIISRLDPRERALSYSVFPLIGRFIKICIFCIAVIWILSAWGYDTTTILAGVGVGGLAVALAAQKTIENLFGGISLISDRPVLVGDVCQFGGQVGTVEDIGLRSTRIRTPDRTVVTIPNSQFSTMTLENFSKRDRMWFHPTLRLRRSTQPDQIRDMMEAVTNILQEHPQIDASGVPLRFSKITDLSFDIDIFAYVLTADYNQYLKVQTEILLKLLEAASERNIEFAVPFSESLTIPFEAQHSSVDGQAAASYSAGLRDKKASTIARDTETARL